MARGVEDGVTASVRNPAALTLAGFCAGVGAVALVLAAVVYADGFVRYGLDLALARALNRFPPPYFWPAILALLGVLACALAAFLSAPTPARASAGAVAEIEAPGIGDDGLLLKAPDLAFLPPAPSGPGEKQR